MSDKDSNVGRDLAGIALFAVGSVLLVSVVVSWINGASLDQRGGLFFLGYLDGDVIYFLGRPAAAVLGVWLSVLGARLFLAGRVPGLPRQLLVGAIGTSLALSVLMGALKAPYGGYFGFHSGNYLTRDFGRWASIPFGFLCVLASIWFALLRPRLGAPQKAVREPDPIADRSTESASAAGAAGRAELASRVTRRDSPTTTEQPVRTVKPLEAVRTQATAGLRPAPLHHESEDQSQAAAVRERADPGPVRPGDAIDAHLADADADASSAAGLAAPAADRDEEVGTPLPLTLAPVVAAVDAATEDDLEVESDAEDEFDDRDDVDDEDLRADELLAADPRTSIARHEAAGSRDGAQPLASASNVPAPSWEQSDLFAEDDEPVDAYGTPLTLVEQLQRRDDDARVAPATPTDRAAAEASSDDDELDELEDDDAEQASEEDEPEFILARADVETDDEEVESEDDETPSGENDGVAAQPQEPAPRARREPSDAALRREAPLFAALDEREAARTTEPDEDEPRVVLRPAAPPIAEPPATSEASSDVAESSAALDEDDLVYKAGVLILERQRVAVSLLQREFKLDFDQATSVLDRLQSSGLIGPYLGGQHRDILLTLDQWRGRLMARP